MQPGKEMITVIKHKARTMTFDGKRGVGRAAQVLAEYRQAGLETVGLKETRQED